ncbi:medium chain dehydrogenase/reductase family protein [Deinococcus hopiensis]|uniref:NADPH2:quinone reductase n=1 Tax=Deinococcus hopiensis KR-140 TaxID=695939 RepID=A0A1W1UP30_9DEIO|nr:medium chain dehydrogenase/reductase family protein [Deinococcus hopiensis]SMB82793.1 NADPH2:quinone reductase [Deinococcus hopiensis KR-140]
MINASTLTTEIVMPGLVQPSGLQLRERALPIPVAGQALVQIDASGVSFAEQSMRRGLYPGQPKFPFVPGYDFVGTVRAVGPGIDGHLIGTRVAAVTKTGGWATHTLVPATDLVPVPPALDPALVEAVLVNGVTAWQMLYRQAHVKAGQTILVHGANGGVGTVLSQLALHAGVRVIGTAAPRHHGALQAMGVEPVDYSARDLAARVRNLAPGGVDAAFDHLGLESTHVSFSLLARGGSLIAYGNAAALNGTDSMVSVFVKLMAQLTLWNALPNTHHVAFYNFWAGHSVGRAAFRRRFHQDLLAVLDLLEQGAITPRIAARFPLSEAAAALELAESRTVQGKVVIVP